MKKLLLFSLLFLLCFSASNVLAVTCYRYYDQGNYNSPSECQQYCPTHCVNYDTYYCEGNKCNCVTSQNCEEYSSCGYGTCAEDEYPQWSCSEGGNVGTCQYNCSYDEFCASGDIGGTNGSTNGGTSGGMLTIENPLGYDNFQDILGAVSKFLFQIGLALAPVMLIIAGFMFVTAAGNPERVTSAKKMALYTLIGLAIILLASGLIAVLKSVIGYTG